MCGRRSISAGLWDAMRNQIVERKVVQMIRENASFKDVPLNPSEPTVAAVDFTIGKSTNAEIPDAKHGGDEQELKQQPDRS